MPASDIIGKPGQSRMPTEKLRPRLVTARQAAGPDLVEPADMALAFAELTADRPRGATTDRLHPDPAVTFQHRLMVARPPER
ncbi:MAG: hypothetical protein QM699_11560 [Amaricoccus sp.]|uniref:hypothetical protein n=1 Tax=Amaricoccus sp. TaxID=1872485 RepID=UPI0039E6D601